MIAILRPAGLLLALMTLLTGVAYPIVITVVAAAIFPQQAAGSLIRRDGEIVASKLIGQNFSDPRYFWSRPSATAPHPYNAAASSGSNLGLLNPALAEAVKHRIEVLRIADPHNPLPVPVDLVTASASGLDPHVSIAAANYQIARVARARGLDPQKVAVLVAAHSEGRTFGFLGEPRVNVVELNLALDGLQ